MKCVNCAGPRTPERCRYCGDGAREERGVQALALSRRLRAQVQADIAILGGLLAALWLVR